MTFFTIGKNCLSFWRYLAFWVFPWICKLQNLWRHFKHYCIYWILFSIKMKLGEILVSLTTNISNSLLFWFWRLGPSSRLFLSFQPVIITQQSIIMSFKVFILFKVCTVAIKIVNNQLLKTNWRHDINIFWKSLEGLKLVYRIQN